MDMKLNSQRFVLNWDSSPTLVQLYIRGILFMWPRLVRGRGGGIGSGHITVLQPNSWEWPLGLTRHAVPMTNTRRATVTCVSHPCTSPPPAIPSQPTPPPHTQSCTVYLMNSTLGAAGVFAGTAKGGEHGPRWPLRAIWDNKSMTLSSGVLWARLGWQISHFHNIRC